MQQGFEPNDRPSDDDQSRLGGVQGNGSGAPPSPASMPTRRVALVAAFVCRKTESIGREVGFPVAVIAATADPARHAARLTATWHAAWTPRDADWFMPFDEGLTIPSDVAYAQLPFDARWLGGAPLPSGVVLEDGCMRVGLPGSLAIADLSAILCCAMADLAFDRVARRPDRVRHRHITHRRTLVAPRYALMVPGDVTRVRLVEDLFSFRPRDLHAVAAQVAKAVSVLALTSNGGRTDLPTPGARPRGTAMAVSRSVRRQVTPSDRDLGA